MFTPNTQYEDALRFSRFDRDHPLSSNRHRIELDGREWPSPEHYLAANLAGNARLTQAVLNAEDGQEAAKLVAPWYRHKKRGWRNLRRVYMTRALYTEVQMYPEVAEYLLDTGNQLLAESSAYDHFWGIGRDQRGENMLGKVWMDIRDKLRVEK